MERRMTRKVTFKAGYAGAQRDVSGEIHDLDATLTALGVKSETLPQVVTADDGMQDGAPRVDAQSGNAGKPQTQKRGDVAKGFAESDAIVEAEFRTQIQTHSALEPHGCLVEP